MSAKQHLPWLDGIRGLSAFYVLLHHAAAEVDPAMGQVDSKELPPWLVVVLAFLRPGHRAVAVFIVLSGFSLMMNSVGTNGEIRGGLGNYLIRRARRILPADYASLAITLLMIAALPVLRRPGEVGRWAVALPAFDAGTILSHVFLVHDMNADWLFKIDPPMWSVAVEWQIYFLFPALVFAWRRAGHVASLAIAILATYGACALLGRLSLMVSPWYACLFALGMLASSTKDATALRLRRRDWAAWLVVLAMVAPLAMYDRIIFGDLLVGIATAAGLVYLGRREQGAETPRFAPYRLLGSRPSTFLGQVSYSLYLIHYPLLSLANNLMKDHQVGATVRLAILMLVAPALIVLLSYPFHLAFEKPLMTRPRKATVGESAPLVAIEPTLHA